MQKSKKKLILDACCGGRMFWFDKEHPNTLYVDKRVLKKGEYDRRPNHSVEPDMVVDFRDMPFEDKSFKLVVFDPPHTFCGEKSSMYKYYGSLIKETWVDDIQEGFRECWRVLDDYGVLIFKWNEVSIKVDEIIEIVGKKPLFGNRPRRSSFKKDGERQTHWLTFMKIPGESLSDLLTKGEA